MRNIRHIVRKEFIQIFRNKTMLPIIFVMPIIQLLVLANAATFEIKNSRIYIVDQDRSTYSHRLIDKLTGSRYFILAGLAQNEEPAQTAISKGDADLMMVIPPHFERDLVKNKSAQVMIALDAINGSAAGVVQGYTLSILQDFNRSVRAEWITPEEQAALPAQIEVRERYWFNPELRYTHFMVPGILVLLVTMVTMFLGAMNIAREKEIGTIEQLNVTPIRKYQFIIGKLLPFWLIGLFELSFGIVIGKVLFNIPMVGSLGLVFLFAMVYMIVVLGMGLLISTAANTQQQAMFIAWFFLVIFILLSGLFTPIESMPKWAQTLTLVNPIRYFVEVMRGVLMKGAGFADIQRNFLVLGGYAIVINALAIWRYRKRV